MSSLPKTLAELRAINDTEPGWFDGKAAKLADEYSVEFISTYTSGVPSHCHAIVAAGLLGGDGDRLLCVWTDDESGVLELDAGEEPYPQKRAFGHGAVFRVANYGHPSGTGGRTIRMHDYAKGGTAAREIPVGTRVTFIEDHYLHALTNGGKGWDEEYRTTY